jgi:DNA-binding transcriptional MerR regulator
MLGVSANTLRSWERRFCFPRPHRTEGGHRQFELAEIEALRRALEQTRNVSSAISIARERGEGLGTAHSLRAALAAYDGERADRLLEESLAVRSLERTVSGMLLAAAELLAAEGAAEGPSQGRGISPEYGFAWRYASGWLAAAQRLAPPATRERGVLILDTTRPPELDALHVQALELFLRRAGMRVLTLPVELQTARVASALSALRADAVVLGGAGASLETLGRFVYAVRRATAAHAPIAVLDYRGALPDTGASTVPRLPPEPEAATAALREALAEPARVRDGGQHCDSFDYLVASAGHEAEPGEDVAMAARRSLGGRRA